ncbi:WD40 repeat-like protein, partial [Rhizopogon vinicolor AM-OR11-026]
VAAVAVFPDGRRMAANSLDGMVRLWDEWRYVKGKGCDWVVGGHVPMRDMALTRDGEIVACSDESGYTTVREWDSSTWKQVGDIWKGLNGDPWRLAVNCNGAVVASLSTNNHIRLWRLSDRQTIAIFRHHGSPCCVTFSMDGKHILVAGKDKKISEW